MPLNFLSLIVNNNNMINDKTNKTLDKTFSEDDASLLNTTEKQHGKAIIYVRLETTHKLTFFLGLVLGVFVLRHQLVIDTSQVS